MPEVDRKQELLGSKSGKSNASKLIAQPVADNPKQRLKWIAHLEFAQSVTSDKGVYLTKEILNIFMLYIQLFWQTML